MATDARLIDDLFEINRRICLDLWNLCDANGIPSSLSPRLIFPTKGSQVRISEQEARIICCDLLNRLSYYFSIETPTKGRYVQTGQVGTRARTDLSLYKFENTYFKQVANIELKAHKSKFENIRKDIEKIVRERLTGNWFHTLKSFHGSTVKDMFKWLKASFLKHSNTFASERISIIFCFCVLKKREAYMRNFFYDPSSFEYASYVSEFFDSSDIRDKWQIFSQSGFAIKPEKKPYPAYIRKIEGEFEKPVWIWEERGSQLRNRFNLRALNWLNLDTELFKELLCKVEAHDPDVNRPFNNKASQEFRKWFEAPNKPLVEAAYALLSNWFLGEGIWYKGKSRAIAAGNLWDELFCARPTKRMTDPQRDYKILKERFESWWFNQRNCQER